jgi:hypothetical protein
MGINSHLSTCVCTQSPKYLEMAQGHISLSAGAGNPRGRLDSARGCREGAVRGEVVELHSGDRRRWSLGERLGRGSGVLSSRQCEEAARLS